MDIKATKNVALSVAVFIVCHCPTIAFAIFGDENHHFGNVWFTFFAEFCPYISKATNPFIFALRGRRFFLALKQFFKDPCGKSPFQEMTPDVLRVKEKNEKTLKKEGKDIEKQAKDRRKPRGKRAAVDCMPQESQQKHRQVKQA